MHILSTSKSHRSNTEPSKKGGRVIEFNTTYNNVSVISLQSVLLVEETRISGENHQSVASHWQTLSHKSCIKHTSPWRGFKLITLVVIGTDWTGCSKSTYRTITNTTTLSLCIRWYCTKLLISQHISDGCSLF